jgi:hypothetical protein
MGKKKPIIIQLNPEKEIGFEIIDGATGKVLKEGSSKVKDLSKKKLGGSTVVKASEGQGIDTEYFTKETKVGKNATKVERIKKSDDEIGYQRSLKKRETSYKDSIEGMKKGGSILVKTKLGRTKPTKIY